MHLKNPSVWIHFLAIAFGISCLGSSSANSQTIADVAVKPVVEAIADVGQLVNTLTTCGSLKPIRILPCDDVWLVNARSAHLCPGDLSQISVQHLQNGKWKDAELRELTQLHAEDSQHQTLVYAHGNRTDLKWAKSRGLQFYGSALQTCRRPPVRYVIFAWKAEKEMLKPVRDFQVKSDRSVRVGTTFGKFLNQFDDRKMVLMGFSLGAQVVLKGVEDAELEYKTSGRYRIMFLAPSISSPLIELGLQHFPRNPTVLSTDVFCNARDRAIKASQVIARRKSHLPFTNFLQLAATNQGSCNALQIRDITAESSKKHSIVEYGSTTKVNRVLASLLSTPFAN